MHEAKSETHISLHPGLAIFVDVQSIASQRNIFAKCSEMKCCAQTQEIEPRYTININFISLRRVLFMSKALLHLVLAAVADLPRTVTLLILLILQNCAMILCHVRCGILALLQHDKSLSLL